MEEMSNPDQAGNGGDQLNGEAHDEFLYITDWRLHGISFDLLLSLFVTQMDTSIASTSILTITADLGGYKKISCVFTSYMLSYCDV